MLKVDQVQFNRDVAKIAKTIDRVGRVLKKDAGGLLKQTAIFAIQSATIATPPGVMSKVSKLPKKFRFRPLVRIPDDFGFFYATESGTIFKTKSIISRSSARRRNLKRVFKGIKAFNRSQKSWSYIPYPGGKRDESYKRFKIPFAGAAKVGWLSALKRLDNKPIDVGQDNYRSGKAYSRVTVRRDLVEIINVVSYVSKIAPQSAAIGLNKDAKRLEHSWIPKIEKRIERDWNKNVNSFVKTLGKLT